jgi:hypothetical protein
MALETYPAEKQLSESSVLIADFINRVQISDMVERAGRAALRGNKKQAERLYRNALTQLGPQDSTDHDRVLAAEKIQSELEQLRNTD